ncbi:hypothetical protein EV401DRAFT_653314 [Pisolithus croceorrhizus]|nr:hypothetical protein EV401DRAFT_653314 [Pisolithus croceorrhizus]
MHVPCKAFRLCIASSLGSCLSWFIDHHSQTPTHTYHVNVSQVMGRHDAQKHSQKGWRRRIVGKSMDTGHEQAIPDLSLSPEEPPEKPAASEEPQGFFTKARQFFRPSSNLPLARNSRSDISDANSGVTPNPTVP